MGRRSSVLTWRLTGSLGRSSRCRTGLRAGLPCCSWKGEAILEGAQSKHSPTSIPQALILATALACRVSLAGCSVRNPATGIPTRVQGLARRPSQSQSILVSRLERRPGGYLSSSTLGSSQRVSIAGAGRTADPCRSSSPHLRGLWRGLQAGSREDAMFRRLRARASREDGHRSSGRADGIGGINDLTASPGVHFGQLRGPEPTPRGPSSGGPSTSRRQSALRPRLTDIPRRWIF